MAAELFWDTITFFALSNTDNHAHGAVRKVAAHAAHAAAARRLKVTSDWMIGECCTLLIARRKLHLVPRFFDYTENRQAFAVISCDEMLMNRTKAFLWQHLDHTDSFVDCTSFVIMAQSGIGDAMTTDKHFTEAEFVTLLAS